MNDPSEDNVLFVKFMIFLEMNNEPGVVSVRSSVVHGKESLVRMRVPYLLIGKGLTVDTIAAFSSVHDNITTVGFSRDIDTMEYVAFVMEVFVDAKALTCAQSSKILARDR